uniref:Transposase Tc1-like domain-containing protein n=1 Tax=Takifugu rubripes TaxID=31033 RepID=A0A674N6B4_TAKRU
MARMVKNNPQTTSEDLQGYLAADSVAVHWSTIQHNLHKERLYERVMQKKPFLHSRHKLSRLRYAKEHLNKPISFWNKILWTDAKKLNCLVTTRGRKRTQNSKKNTFFPQ